MPSTHSQAPLTIEEMKNIQVLLQIMARSEVASRNYRREIEDAWYRLEHAMSCPIR